MAYTEIYVDPSIAADSGTGTSGDPYGDLQYALDSESHDATNGTRFNIKSGTAEVLAGQLDFTTYGTSTFPSAGPCIFEGYQATAGDWGTRAEVDANGYSFIKDTAMDNIIVLNLELHGSGASNNMFQCDSNGVMVGCLVYDFNNGFYSDGSDYCCFNHFHDFSGIAVRVRSDGVVNNNWIEINENSASGITHYGAGGSVSNNVLVNRATSPTGPGVQLDSGVVCEGNTLYSENLGTSKALMERAATAFERITVLNNVISGWGVAVSLPTSRRNIVSGNLYYNNTTNEDVNQLYGISDGGKAAGGDPFVDAANDDFTLISAYQGGAYPATLSNGSQASFRDQGAIQHEDAGGGGTPLPRAMLG